MGLSGSSELLSKNLGLSMFINLDKSTGVVYCLGLGHSANT